MSGFVWKSTLAKVAPGIATALGGPMAGVAVGMATKALGLDDNSEGALEAAVASGNPDVLVTLKEVENNFRLELKRMDVSLEEISAKDRDSARGLAIAKGTQPQIILSTVYTVGYFWLLYELFTGEITIADDVKGIVNTLMGVMTAAQVQIMNFWFGSSAGSKAKVSPNASSKAGS